MSRANLEIVERAIIAVNARDAAAYSDLCHPDWELATPLAPLEGTFKGEAGIRAFFSALDEATESFTFCVDELRLVDDDRVLAHLRLSVVSQGGVPITQSVANVYELLDGKLRRVSVYFDRDRAFAELGLAPEAGAPDP
jgi:ketosteroid isomerase-like protein